MRLAVYQKKRRTWLIAKHAALKSKAISVRSISLFLKFESRYILPGRRHQTLLQNPIALRHQMARQAE